MKSSVIVFMIGIAATASACIMSQESSFFAKFSMRDMVTSSNSIKGFQCDPAGGGGTGGGGGGISSSSGGFSGGIHFQSHKSDAFVCRLHSNTLPAAEEEQLIVSLRKHVEDSLRAYGANISESGSREPRSFYFSYAIKDIHGQIQVSGKRIGVDFYNLQAELEESK